MPCTNITLLLFLLLIVNHIIGGDTVENNGKHRDGNFQAITHITNPISLHVGEVSNNFDTLPIPDGPIAIYEFAADIVEIDERGAIVPVPLNDAYLHHHVIYSSRKLSPNQTEDTHKKNMERTLGFGAGSESRGISQKFNYPYAFITEEGENEVIASIHIINTRGMSQEDAGHCVECPCTTIDTNGTDGSILQVVGERRESWETCNLDLVSEQNTGCSVDSYHGGFLCCEDGEFCLDNYDVGLTGSSDNNSSSVVSTYYLRYTITYTQVTEENRPLYVAACCDVTGNLTLSGNIEYDIPKHDCDNQSTTCGIHTLSTVQLLHHPGKFGIFYDEQSSVDPEERYVDVVYMVGHLHRGGIEITAYDNTTGELLCASKPTYGSGNEVGNEKGYLVAMSSCTFDPPKRMKTTDPIFITNSYDATQSHTGVMSLFYIALSDANDTVVQDENKSSNSDDVGSFDDLAEFSTAWKCLVLLLTMVALVLVISSKYFARKPASPTYEMVTNSKMDGHPEGNV